MDKQELITLPAGKAIDELDWDSIEFLFKPTTIGTLLLRLDFDKTMDMVYQAFASNSPTTKAHKFTSPLAIEWIKVIEFEEFYRELKEFHEIKEKLG